MAASGVDVDCDIYLQKCVGVGGGGGGGGGEANLYIIDLRMITIFSPSNNHEALPMF